MSASEEGAQGYVQTFLNSIQSDNATNADAEIDVAALLGQASACLRNPQAQSNHAFASKPQLQEQQQQQLQPMQPSPLPPPPSQSQHVQQGQSQDCPQDSGANQEELLRLQIQLRHEQEQLHREQLMLMQTYLPASKTVDQPDGSTFATQHHNELSDAGHVTSLTTPTAQQATTSQMQQAISTLQHIQGQLYIREVDPNASHESQGELQLAQLPDGLMVQHDSAGAGTLPDQGVTQTEHNALSLNMYQTPLFNVGTGVNTAVNVGTDLRASAPQAYCAADPQSVLGQNLPQMQAQLQVPLQEQLPVGVDIPVMNQSGLQPPTLASAVTSAVEDQMLYNQQGAAARMHNDMEMQLTEHYMRQYQQGELHAQPSATTRVQREMQRKIELEKLCTLQRIRQEIVHPMSKVDGDLLHSPQMSEGHVHSVSDDILTKRRTRARIIRRRTAARVRQGGKEPMALSYKTPDGDAQMERYKCANCPRVFSAHFDLVTHERTVHKKRLWGCPACWKSYAQSHLLRKHMESKHGMHIRWACVACDALFFDARSLRMHCLTKHSDIELTSGAVRTLEQVNKERDNMLFGHAAGESELAGLPELYEPDAEKADVVHACWCGWIFDTAAQLDEHKATVHGAAASYARQCKLKRKMLVGGSTRAGKKSNYKQLLI